MKKFNIISALIFFCGVAFTCYAQKFGFEVGKATTDNLTKSAPTQFIVTFPAVDTIDNSWLVDGYFQINMYSNRKKPCTDNDTVAFTLGLVGEIHKNTLTAKEQDNRQAGLTFSKDFEIFTDVENSCGSTYRQILGRIITSGAAKYTNTKKKDDNGKLQNNRAFLVNLSATAALEGGQGLLRILQPQTRLININSWFAYIFVLSHDHSIGFSYIGGEDGKALLLDGSFELSLYPLSALTHGWFEQAELFEFKWKTSARTELVGSCGRDLNPLQTFSAGLNCEITKEKSSAGIFYNWQKGADPYTGLENQEYRTVSAKVRLVIN